MSLATAIFRLARVDFDHSYFETAVFWRVHDLVYSAGQACYLGAAYGIIPAVLQPFLQRCVSVRTAINVLRFPKTCLVLLTWPIFISTSNNYPSPDSVDIVSRIDLGQYRESVGSWSLQILRRIFLGLSATASGFILGRSLFQPLERWHPYAPATALLVLVMHDGIGEYTGFWPIPKLLGYINPQLEDVYWFPLRPFRDFIITIFNRFLLLPARHQLWNRKITSAITFLGTHSGFPPFQYLPIETERKIRVLVLKANSEPVRSGNQPIHISCRFETVCIDENIEYEAISYVWGSSTLDHFLTLGFDTKTHIPITKSLYDILKVLAPLAGEKKYWIDAICINQQDSMEKAMQISLMREIYGRANRVLGFIQDNSGENSLGFLLNQLTVSNYKLIDHLSRNFPSERHTMAALTTFLLNPYWRRVWIIQELAMARQVVLYYNQVPVPWSVLINCNYKLEWFAAASAFWTWVESSSWRWEDGVDLIISLTTIPKLMALYILSLRVEGKGIVEDVKLSIVDNVNQFRNSQATQAVDKVYALLGLSEDGNLSQFRPDYQKELWQVYASVLELALRSGNFELFSLAGYHGHSDDLVDKDQLTSLPSWVPDLNQSPRLFTTEKYHSRGYNTGTSKSIQFEILAETRQLRLKGIYFDKIKQCSKPVGSYNLLRILGEKAANGFWEDMSDAVSAYCDSLKEVVKMLDNLPRTYHGGINRREALWRTVIEDYDGKSHPANSSVGQNFQDTLFWLRLFEIVADAAELDNGSYFLQFLSRGGLAKVLSHSSKIMELSGDETVQKHIMDNHDEGLGILSSGSMLLFSDSCFAITENGYMAVVPNGIRRGDIVMIPLGSPAPQILRQSSGVGSTHFFCGEAYVHGIMKGEAFNSMNFDEQWFILE